MNMFKKNGGFTLVELIVVIAILAILAGIAVPAYSGYLQSAQKAGDITALGAVKTAAFAAVATEGEVDKIEVGAVEGVVEFVMVTMVDPDESDDVDAKTFVLKGVAAGDAAKDYELYMNNAAVTLKANEFATGAQWEGDEWVKFDYKADEMNTEAPTDPETTPGT